MNIGRRSQARPFRAFEIYALTSFLVLILDCSKAREPGADHEPPPPKVPQTLEAAPTRVPLPDPIVRDLPVIQEDATLKVLFTFNSTGYFIYRGETMGYEYELLRTFARESGLNIESVVVRDSKSLFDKLNRGEGDVVAAQLVETPNESEVLQTAALYDTKPTVVQRKGDNPAAGLPAEVSTAIEREERETADVPIRIRARLINDPRELGGQAVHMPQTSPYWRHILELNDELLRDIEVVEVDETTDKLIQRLAEGEIGYTVTAENVAALRTAEYTNLLIKPAIGPPEHVVWAVRRNAPALHDALNQFLARKKKSGLLNVLYKKYFLDRRGFKQRISSQYLAGETGQLSPYDSLFREYAKIPGWDWRLLAAQAYQESRFNPRAKSWAGAAGLMQIMPRTARELKINPWDTRQSVEGACRYLWKLDDHWKEEIRDEPERIRFILASYNVGLGHVEDARRLADKNGGDSKSWREVAYWLIRKSKRSVYNDPVVKYGFARGTETVTYVETIMDRYQNYRQFVREDPAITPDTTPAP
jgi:membrane-bound lytic murein transglycosylase F